MVLIFAFLLPFGAGCASKYESAECETPLNRSSDSDKYRYKPHVRSLNFDRVIEENGFKFYYESGLSGRKIDHSIDSVKRVQEFCEIPQTIYLVKDTVTHVNVDGLWINPNDNTELIGAVLLESASESELPFGIFAGVSASLLGEEVEYSVYSEKTLKSRLEEYSYVKELQYPLYTDKNTTKKERETAWNFAYKLGETYLETHSAEDLHTATVEEISLAMEAVGATLPEYYFPVGDYYYAIQIKTGYFNYYFSYDFKDSRLSEKEFSMEYQTLKEFAMENEEITSRNLAIFGRKGFPQKIDIFAANFDDLVTEGMTYPGNYVSIIRSVSCVMHEIMHTVLYEGGDDAYLKEELCEYFANPSTYRQMYYFQQYQEKIPDALKDKAEKQVLKDARKLYTSKYGKADFSNFDFENWLDCVAVIVNENHAKFYDLRQIVSFVKYIYENYGLEVLKDINDDLKIQNGDFTFDDLIVEWRSYLIEKYGN